MGVGMKTISIYFRFRQRRTIDLDNEVVAIERCYSVEAQVSTLRAFAGAVPGTKTLFEGVWKMGKLESLIFQKLSDNIPHDCPKVNRVRSVGFTSEKNRPLHADPLERVGRSRTSAVLKLLYYSPPKHTEIATIWSSFSIFILLGQERPL